MTDCSHIILQQALHGYQDGHRLLSGSYKPKGLASKTLLNLSDSSGPNLPLNHRGYVTGYPLPDTKFYVLAKTWPAPEQSRPGCVWTHSLLINVSDLGLLKNPTILLNVFQRPQLESGFDIYEKPIQIQNSNIHGFTGDCPKGILRNILKGLYCFPEKTILLNSSETIDFDWWLFSIWGQQWPRLRRSFKFCTFALSDRSTQDSQFDLQVLAPEIEGTRSWNQNSSIHLGLQKIEINNELGWMDTAIEDLLSLEDTPFKIHLWKYGADTDGGRIAFVPLAQTWLAIENTPRSPNFDAVILALEKSLVSFPSLDNRLAILISQNLEETIRLTKRVLGFLLNKFSFLEATLEKDEVLKVAKVAWEQGPETSWAFLQKFAKKAPIFTSAFSRLIPATQFISKGEDDPELLALLISKNPSIAASPEIWTSGEGITFPVAEEIKKHPKVGKEVSEVMLRVGPSEVVKMAFQNFGHEAFEAFLSQLETDALSKKQIEICLAEIKSRPFNLLELISKYSISNIYTLSLLVSIIDPCHSNPSPEKDLWVSSFEATKDFNITRNLKFGVFLLSRGLCKVSPESGKLISLAFDPIYDSLANSKLKNEDWGKLNKLLPNLSFYNDWDRCLRLRSAVAQVFVSEKLSFYEFVKVTKNDKTFKELVNSVTKIDEGSYYLKNGLSALIDDKAITKKRKNCILKAIEDYEN